MKFVSKEELEKIQDKIIPPEELIKQIDDRIAFLDEKERKGIKSKKQKLTKEEQNNLDNIKKAIDKLIDEEKKKEIDIETKRELFEQYKKDLGIIGKKVFDEKY